MVNTALKLSLANSTSIIIPWADKQTLTNPATMEWSPSQMQMHRKVCHKLSYYGINGNPFNLISALR